MAKLYHFPLSPFCRKVRLSLAEKKIALTLNEASIPMSMILPNAIDTQNASTNGHLTPNTKSTTRN